MYNIKKYNIYDNLYSDDEEIILYEKITYTKAELLSLKPQIYKIILCHKKYRKINKRKIYFKNIFYKNNIIEKNKKYIEKKIKIDFKKLFYNHKKII